MVRIFVDDERECPKGFLCARTYEEATELLLKHREDIEFLTLDCVLGGGQSGYDIIEFMENNKIFPPIVNCHTSTNRGVMGRFAKDCLPKSTITTYAMDSLFTLVVKDILEEGMVYQPKDVGKNQCL